MDDLASLFGLCASMGLSVVSLILPSVMYLFGSRFGLHSVGAIFVLVRYCHYAGFNDHYWREMW